MFHKKISQLSKAIKNTKKHYVIGIIFVFFLILVSIVVYAPKSNAGILQDIYNNIIKKYTGGDYVNLPSTKINNNAEKSNANTKNINKNNDFTGVANYEQSVINAVAKTTPAVVSIVITKDIPVITRCPYNPFPNLPEEFQQFFGNGMQFYTQCQKGMKKKEVGGGSGFIVSSDGIIVTNKHVVADKNADYSVLTNDGKTYKAKVLARHPILDLAIIKINAHNLPIVKFGNSDNIKLGQTVMSIGNALGQFRNTVSRGIVSGLARNITASSPVGGSETINNVIQTDAAINPGNSGGPLINIYGEVIGINVAMVSGAQNIGFAIPINEAKKAIESVKKSGKIKVAYLGVRYVMLNSLLAKNFNIDIDHGALLKGDGKNFAVVPGSPAGKAGLREGDVIVSVDGIKLDKNYPLAHVISSKNPGDSVSLKVWRNGKDIDISVVLGERQ